jgi:hypothetical protein
MTTGVGHHPFGDFFSAVAHDSFADNLKRACQVLRLDGYAFSFLRLSLSLKLSEGL